MSSAIAADTHVVIVDPAIPLLGLVTKHEHGMAATGMKATRRAHQIRGDLGKPKEMRWPCRLGRP
jgi:hypothetical protein